MDDEFITHRTGKPPGYRAYILRCWAVPAPGADPAARFRCSLEDPRTGERHGFGSMLALLAFLQTHLTDENATS
jgi:hypothetical protein